MRYIYSVIYLLLLTGNIQASTYAAGQEPYRIATSFDPAGTTVELDDASVWRIEGNDSRAVVRQWLAQDRLVIYPVVCTFWTGTRYYIYNQRTMTSANAELSLGPVVGGPCNNRIVYIDYHYGEVRLQDGQGYISTWIADPNDLQIIQDWHLYQSVILGSNNSWPANWSSHCHSILINVESNNYIRAEIH